MSRSIHFSNESVTNLDRPLKAGGGGCEIQRQYIL